MLNPGTFQEQDISIQKLTKIYIYPSMTIKVRKALEQKQTNSDVYCNIILLNK